MKKFLSVVFLLLFITGCTSNGSLDTAKLKVDQVHVHTFYLPVDKQTAAEAVPYEIEYPSEFPFKTGETKVNITDWNHSKEKVVVSTHFPSVEKEQQWEGGSFTQPAIPQVTYTVANFDRYYSKYAKQNEFKKVTMTDGSTALFKMHDEVNGASLHWFKDGKEYNLDLLYETEDTEKLKAELLKIAGSI